MSSLHAGVIAAAPVEVGCGADDVSVDAAVWAVGAGEPPHARRRNEATLEPKAIVRFIGPIYHGRMPMDLDALAKRLADPSRLGMSPALADKLKLKSDEVVRGQLMAMTDGDRGPYGVYLLGIYVVDDTDLFDDGEIYWWSIPVMVDKLGKASWSSVTGLPAGAAPHKCGSLEWMTNISLKEPPLLACIPADEEITSCVVRLGIYDDDKKPADVAAALAEGYGSLANCLREGLPGASQIVTPVRDAIYRALKAEDDDVLIDEDVTIRRGESLRFNSGFVGSTINAKARAYYVVKDEQRTDMAGPLNLRKGEQARLVFASDLEPGGRLSIFARGADVECPVFGDLTTDRPFAGKVLDTQLAKSLAAGFEVTGTGPAKVVAFYTPP
jgi:hypothetical protein